MVLGIIGARAYYVAFQWPEFAGRPLFDIINPATGGLAIHGALIGAIATGLARALYYGQDMDYYLANRLFWLKIALFVGLAVAAVGPSLQYLRWSRVARSAPAFAPLTREVERVRGAIALGLGFWLILPLVSILVARGFGGV